MNDDPGMDLAPTDDPDDPVPYLQRIGTYYEALGYGAPYAWAQFAPVSLHI